LKIETVEESEEFMSKKILWESPTKGKGTLGMLRIDGKTKTVSIILKTYGYEKPLFKGKIEGITSIEIYDSKTGNCIAEIPVSPKTVRHLRVFRVEKIVKRPVAPHKSALLEIYCVDEQLRRERR
jgi:hypothetical protein